MDILNDGIPLRGLLLYDKLSSAKWPILFVYYQAKYEHFKSFFYYKITFVNSQHESINLKGDFELQN